MFESVQTLEWPPIMDPLKPTSDFLIYVAAGLSKALSLYELQGVEVELHL